jgi:hypothetical protein
MTCDSGQCCKGCWAVGRYWRRWRRWRVVGPFLRARHHPTTVAGITGEPRSILASVLLSGTEGDCGRGSICTPDSRCEVSCARFVRSGGGIDASRMCRSAPSIISLSSCGVSDRHNVNNPFFLLPLLLRLTVPAQRRMTSPPARDTPPGTTWAPRSGSLRPFIERRNIQPPWRVIPPGRVRECL